MHHLHRRCDGASARRREKRLKVSKRKERGEETFYFPTDPRVRGKRKIQHLHQGTHGVVARGLLFTGSSPERGGGIENNPCPAGFNTASRVSRSENGNATQQHHLYTESTPCPSPVSMSFVTEPNRPKILESLLFPRTVKKYGNICFLSHLFSLSLGQGPWQALCML